MILRRSRSPLSASLKAIRMPIQTSPPLTSQSLNGTTRVLSSAPVSQPTSTGTPAAMTDDRCLRSMDELLTVLRSQRVKSLFAVVDAGAYRHSGAEEKLAEIFSEFPVTCFDQFEPNPKSHDVLSGIQLFRESGADLVIAIGGGSAIDIAKVIAATAEETASLEDLILRRAPFTAQAVPLIAIPTTSGTGSEATQFAVVYIDGAKHSLDDPRLLPDWCVLDSQLTHKLPRSITANTGLDAFCQAVESLWSARSTESSMRQATEAATLAFRHLQQAVQQGTPEAREALSRASHLAGRAIQQTRTTASHAVSYTLTSEHGIPHGHAVALTLGAMLEHNAAVTEADCNDPRGPEHVRASIRRILTLLNCETAKQGRERIETWIRSLGCQTRLHELGISGRGTMEQIATKTNAERLGNNPRLVTHSQLITILESIQ